MIGSAIAFRTDLPQLTSLRYFAALLIVFHHFGPKSIGGMCGLLDNALRMGGAGVGFFFVLSGFVMCWVYWNDENLIDVAKYYKARFARIYPVYLLGFCLAGAILILIPHSRIPGVPISSYGWAALLGSTLLQSWVPVWANLINGPGWSLSTEMFFYALFPLFVRKGWGARFLAKPGCWIAFFCVLGALPAILSVCWLSQRQLESVGWSNFLGFFPVFRLPEFLTGICFGLLCRKRPDWIRQNLTGYLIFAAALAVVGTVLCLATGKWVVVFHNGLLSPAFGFIISFLALAKGRAAGWLSGPRLVLLGEASYSLYILHMPLKSLYAFGWRSIIGPEDNGLFLLTLVVFLTGSSLLSYRWFEKPVRRFFREGWAR